MSDKSNSKIWGEWFRMILLNVLAEFRSTASSVPAVQSVCKDRRRCEVVAPPSHRWKNRVRGIWRGNFWIIKSYSRTLMGRLRLTRQWSTWAGGGSLFCCCFFCTSFSADLISSSVTPWVDRRVSRTRFAWAFLWVSLSSSLTGGTKDLVNKDNN